MATLPQSIPEVFLLEEVSSFTIAISPSPKTGITYIFKFSKFSHFSQGEVFDDLTLTSSEELALELMGFKDSYQGTQTFACVLGERGGRNHICSASDYWRANHFFWGLSAVVFAKSSHVQVLSTPSSVSGFKNWKFHYIEP